MSEKQENLEENEQPWDPALPTFIPPIRISPTVDYDEYEREVAKLQVLKNHKRGKGSRA
ncbi:MAG TPA: hypothetical protein VFP93_00600 [Gammaproteobacteria bacterium]|nr:hypothetical protein [Gammaproteobacteria bacterium]